MTLPVPISPGRSRSRAARTISSVAIAAMLCGGAVAIPASAEVRSTDTESVPRTTVEADGMQVEELSVTLDSDWDGDSAAGLALLAPHDHSDSAAHERSVAAVRMPTAGVTVDLSTTSASMLILESTDGRALGAVAVRSRNDGQWSEWNTIDGDAADQPDGLPGEEGSTATGPVTAAGPIWIGDDADAVEIAHLGSATRQLEIEALTPALAPGARPAAELPPLAAAQAGQPIIQPRSSWTSAGWAFDNDTCENGPIEARNVEAMVVHHTVTTNSYSADQVAGLIQGIRRFHVDTRGWCDIAYNFMVDKFGRIWEARMGGIDLPIQGGHTLGFNTATSGVAVLGTHSSVTASQAVIDAIAALADWKLGLHGADPLGTVWLKSRTTKPAIKYPNGTWVRAPRLVGHRDLVSTSCPGNGLHPSIPGIRAQIAVTTDDAPYDFPRRNPLDSGPAVFVVDQNGTVRPAGAAEVPSAAPSALASGRAVAVDGANGRGFVLADSGAVISFGGAGSPGSPAGGATAVDLVASDDGNRGWVLDSSGTLHGFNGSPTITPSGSLPGTAVAALVNDGGRGYVLGSSGQLVAVGGAPSRSIGVSIAAVDVALMADGTSGWVLDVAGQLHPFGDAPAWQSDLAGASGGRARAVLADPTDRGGWVLDSEGMLHAFGQLRRVQPLTTTTGNPVIADAALWWHLPSDLPSLEDPAYTRGLFELFLDRPGTLTELDYWTWRIEDEHRSAAAEEFANSEEWAGVIVDEIYVDVLGRPPEPEGRAFWVGRLSDGLRTQDLGAQFYSSPEYVAAAGSSTEYVTRLYRALLHREPDDVGLGFWVGKLDRGQAVPGDIAAGFYQSVESRNDRVTRLYEAILGRAPEPEGRDFWAGRLLAEDDIALAVDLAVSDEFFDRVTGG